MLRGKNDSNLGLEKLNTAKEQLLVKTAQG